jgi:formylglycine-generating enzyme required for sulfatase activity
LHHQWGALLSGLLLAETADPHSLSQLSGDDAIAFKRVRKWLVHILKENLLPVVDRVAAGNALSKIGDPRFRGREEWHLPSDELLGFVKIHKGVFTMGGDKAKDHRTHENEMPHHRLGLNSYYISRYPVTVAQFRAFVEDPGDKKKCRERLVGLDNHPVVEVSWHDAVAYCNWLYEKLLNWEGIPKILAGLLRPKNRSAWRITLPSEAEWEKAARGADGRTFPWRTQSESLPANYEQTGIGTTSAVGCFVKGKSPYDCIDMSGNVWEWTRSIEKKYPYLAKDGREESGALGYRVLRGGAFDSTEDDLRCSHRGRNAPGNASTSYGFRVVLTRL